MLSTQNPLIKVKPISVFTLRTDSTSAGPGVSEDQLIEQFGLGLVIRSGGAVGIAPERTAGDQGSNSAPREYFSLNLN